MAGLTDFLSPKDIQTTSLPNWYSSATQNVGTSLGNISAPAAGSTTLQSAVGSLSPTGGFAQGQNILSSIGSGAANPWLVSQSPTGAKTVAPNVNTPMGGLFQAQTDYLNRTMGDIKAVPTAKAIGSGGFGGKMNLAAIEKAKGDALSDLFQKQMTASLQNQQTGVSAGTGLGSLGGQQAQAGLNVAQYQANEPFATQLNRSKILSTLRPDETQTRFRDPSILEKVAAASKAVGPTGAVADVVKLLGGGAGGLTGLVKSVYDNVSSGGTTGGTTGGMYDPGAFGTGDPSGNIFEGINPEDYFGTDYSDYLNNTASAEDGGWGNYGE